jgi:putative inorganic carbon (HCO3(-)) transporter
MIERRLSDSPVDQAYEERAGLMRMAVRVIASQPLSGVGPGAYAYTYKTFLTPELREQWLATVHNAYLLRAAETGIPGGIALVLLLAAGLRQALRLTRARSQIIRITAIGWSAALIAVCWEMNWDIWRGFTYNALLWFLLGLMEAAENLSRSANGWQRDPQPADRRRPAASGPAL